MSCAPGEIVHASAVAVAGRGVLILGASGAGKSALAIRMIALGAELISDDRTRLRVTGHGLLELSCPSPQLQGLLEARGVGILRLAPAPAAFLALVVDLDREETERLPPPREWRHAAGRFPLVLRSRNDHLAETLMLWMKGAGRVNPDMPMPGMEDG